MRKFDRAMSTAAKLGVGEFTFTEVYKHVPVALQEQLTGRQLGAVVAAMHSQYKAGRASTGAEVTEDKGAVWIDHLQRMIELS